MDSTSSATASSAPQVESFLTRLRCPATSELARKRKVATNPPAPPTGRKRSKGRNIGDPKSVSPSERIKQFPEENLKVLNKKLFCDACREPLSVKKSVIEVHIKSSKHIKGKVGQASKERREKSISDMLTKYDQEVHPVGECLPSSVRIYRVKTVTAFLKNGVPLSKIDGFRQYLEENGGFSLSGSQHLRELIPPILSEERKRIGQLIAKKHVSLIFDGTTHVAEALVVLLRFVDAEWNIKQFVVRLMLLAKSLTGEEVARQIISTLSTELCIPSELLVAAMRDRASVNDVAMRTVSIIYSI